VNIWILITGCMLMATAAWAAPRQTAYQGYLTTNDNEPIEGDKNMIFRLYDAQAGGHIAWEEQLRVSVTHGRYSAVLGTIHPINETLLSQGSLFWSVSVDGEELLPRQQVVSVPYAVMCETSKNVAGGAVDASQIAVSGKQIIDRSGNWVGPSLPSALPIQNCREGDVLRFSREAWQCVSVTQMLSGY
jgi:hypothetical protein